MPVLMLERGNISIKFVSAFVGPRAGRAADAVAAINWLKAKRLPAVTFYPLNRLKDYYQSNEVNDILGQRGVIGLATDLISYNSEYQKVFESIHVKVFPTLLWIILLDLR